MTPTVLVPNVPLTKSGLSQNCAYSKFHRRSPDAMRLCHCGIMRRAFNVSASVISATDAAHARVPSMMGISRSNMPSTGRPRCPELSSTPPTAFNSGARAKHASVNFPPNNAMADTRDKSVTSPSGTPRSTCTTRISSNSFSRAINASGTYGHDRSKFFVRANKIAIIHPFY